MKSVLITTQDIKNVDGIVLAPKDAKVNLVSIEDDYLIVQYNGLIFPLEHTEYKES